MRKKKTNRVQLFGSNRKEIAGLSNKDLADRAGVSVRTVQRYKSGTSFNKRVMEEIQKEYNKQILEKQKILKDYVGKNETSGVLRNIEIKRGYGLLDYENKTVEELEKAINLSESILQMKTLTPEGFEEWKSNTRSAAERTFGVSGDRLDSALSAFNRLMEDDITRSYLENKYNSGRSFDSKQRVNVIRKLFSDKRYSGDYDRIYENVRGKALSWYNDRSYEEFELM